MTQASSSGPTATSVANRPVNMLKRSNSGSETLQTSEAQSVDLAGVFKRITNKAMIIPRDLAFDTSKVANPPTELRKEAAGPQPPKTIAHYFGLQAQPQQQQQQSFSSINEGNVIKEDAANGKGPSKKDENVKSIDSKRTADILKRAVDLGDRRAIISQTGTNSKMGFPDPRAAPRSQSSSSSGIETLRQLIGLYSIS